MSSEKRITVIGSNSFSGASFIKHCLEQGFEVLGFSRSSELDRVFLPYRWVDEQMQGRFKFVQADLNHDSDLILDRITSFASPYIINFAAQGMVAQSWLHPEHWYQTNVVGNVVFHDGLRKTGNLRKYLHVSTPEVYGSTSGLIDENAPFNPSTPYAASRAACDLHLKTFFQQYDFPVVWTRAANVFGPGQQLYRIIPRTILFILLGRKLSLHGGGHSVRSFIHIQDVADATLKALLKAEPGKCYHLSTSRNISIRSVVELICDKMGVPFEQAVEISEDRPGKDAAYLLDSARARRELGWADEISLEDGIQQTLDWVRDNLEELKRQPMDYIHKP